MMTIWDAINNLYSKRMKYPEDSDLVGNLWMINRFLSMDNDLLEVVADVSKYFYTLKERYYRLLYRIIPQDTYQRSKYVKPKKEFNEDLVKRYSKLYGVSNRETIDCLRILQKTNTVKEIYEFVGLECKNE